jgi:hypothetical protein
MSSSANVKLRYEKCLGIWGNAKALTISEYPLYISHLKCFNPPVIFIDMT